MVLLTRTFKVALGGRGKEEVDKFIRREIGRDLTKIESISAVSLNETTTELTLTYKSQPDTPPVQTTNPLNGFISGTGNFVDTLYLQYASPISEATVSNSRILFDGTGIATGTFFVEPSANSYIMSVHVTPQYSGAFEGIHTILLDKSIEDDRGNTQESSSLVGWTATPTAGPNLGQEQLYSLTDLRGETTLRYAVIDSTSDATKKVKEMLRGSEELLAFATVQKTNRVTELYTLLLTSSEPKVVAMFPRHGAINPDEDPFEVLTLTFKEPIDTEQLQREPLIAVSALFKSSKDIPFSRINAVDTKTIQIDIAGAFSDLGITNNHVNIILKPGIKSINGLVLTKGYTFGHNTNNFVAGGGGGGTGPQGDPGPEGPPGPTGATGASGDRGPAGPIGPSGLSGASGDKGDKGDQGDVGPQDPLELLV
jgi:hypothetical protein